MRGVFLVLSLVTLFGKSVLGQVCNAFNDALIEVDLSYPTLPEDPFTIIFPSVYNSGSESVTLVAPDEDDGTGGIAATFWHTETRRIADGFKATFSFTYTGNSDGLAFVVQNDKVVDIEGTGGAGLGFFNGLDKYIAVGFDVCDQGSKSSRYPCDSQSDVLVSVSGQGVFPAGVDVYDTELVNRTHFPRGEEIGIEVYYLALDNRIVVLTTDGFTLIDATLTGFTNVEEHFDSRFGRFGFTASNGFNAEDAGTFTVNSFELANFVSEIRVSDEADESFPKKVALGKQTVIDIVVVDECNEPSEAKKDALNITENSVSGYLTTVTDTGVEILEMERVVDSGDGTFSMIFLMPKNVLADWDFVATIEGNGGTVDLQGVPIESAITTVTPEAAALPLYGLILLIVLLSLLVLAMVYVIRRLYRYRLKLKENEDDILWGKEARQMDILEQSVTFTMNPLMGTLEEMEEKLAANNKILADLRKGDTMVENIDATVADLKKKNAELRKQLKQLKIKEQKQEAMRNRRSQRKYRAKAPRQEFNQERP